MTTDNVSENLKDRSPFRLLKTAGGNAYTGSPQTAAAMTGCLSIAGTASLFHKERCMAWFVLFLAGLFEIGWAIGLKYTDGFSRPVPTALTAASMVVSVVLLGLAVKSLPIGTAYAIWTGIGTLGTVILGIWLLGDAATPARLVCIGLIVVGIAGLKLA
jgi:quaternary ammonium compound-resistance protein SugE